MRVFLAGIIQGSQAKPTIHNQDWREPIKEVLARHVPTVKVYCHYSRHPHSIRYDMPAIRRTFAQGIEQAVAAELLIAYLPSASMGTAIEMREAHRAGRAVVAITPLAANWVVRLYSDRILADVAQFEAFCASGELDALLAEKRTPRP